MCKKQKLYEQMLSSDTYHQLVTKPYLQEEEGSLFVCELLEKELASGDTK